MPSGSGLQQLRKTDIREKLTPALAKPKIGTIDEGDTGLQRMLEPVQRRIVGSSGRPRDGVEGIVRASATPAIVACTPDCSTRTQRTSPRAR